MNTYIFIFSIKSFALIFKISCMTGITNNIILGTTYIIIFYYIPEWNIQICLFYLLPFNIGKLHVGNV